MCVCGLIVCDSCVWFGEEVCRLGQCGLVCGRSVALGKNNYKIIMLFVIVSQFWEKNVATTGCFLIGLENNPNKIRDSFFDKKNKTEKIVSQ